jgi:hypothetical protein
MQHPALTIRNAAFAALFTCLQFGATAHAEPFVLADFEAYADAIDSSVLFRYPGFSGDNIGNDDLFEDIAMVRSVSSIRVPAAAADNPAIGQYLMHLSWTNMPEIPDFTNTRYVRVRTAPLSPAEISDPIISFEHPFSFAIFTDKPVEVVLLLRETHSTGDYGTNGGRTGSVKWLGVTGERETNGVTGGIPVPANEWVTMVFDIPAMAANAVPRTGEGPLVSTTGKGVFEALGFIGAPGVTYNVFLDNFMILLDDPVVEDKTFLGYVIDEGQQWLDTGAFAGWLYIGQQPWVYAALLQNWVYIDDSTYDPESANGVWAYILK